MGATDTASGAEAASPASSPARPEPGDVELIESPAPDPTLPALPEGRFGPSENEVKPNRVNERVDKRTADSDTWVNDDGTSSITTYALPRYFQPKGSRDWAPIETGLVADGDKPGRARSKANRWASSFGPAGSPDGMQRLELESRTVTFSPVGADPSVAPSFEGSTATYRDLWPAADAVYTVSALGTHERLVLGTPTAPTSFAFDVSGATPRLNGRGGIDLVADGSVVASVPPLTVETTGGLVRPERAGAEF